MIFCVGSAILFIPSILAATAQRDAWLASILGTILGLGLIWFYSKLYVSLKGQTLVQMYDSIFGKWVGKFMTLQFIFYLIFLSSLILRGIGDFLTTQIMKETPMEILIIVLILVVVHGYKYGIQTIARSIEVFMPTLIILYVIALILVTKESKLIKLFPIMENGLKPIINGSFSLFNFPFTEVVIMLMFLPVVKDQDKLKKTFLFGTFLGGIALFFPVFFGIITMGPNMLANDLYPTYTLAKKLGFKDIFERIEVILAIIWLLSIYFKLLLCFTALTESIGHLFNLSERKSLIFPVGWILYGTTILLADSNVYFFEFNAKIWPVYALTIGFLIPMAMFVVHKIKQKIHGSQTL